MGTWSDKQLGGHKRAQGYISAGTAALGVSALGAAGLKSGAARRGAVKLARVAGGGKRGAGVLRAREKAASSAGGLTTTSAGVGGIGGFNFAAIQGQEAKRAKKGVHKALSPDVAASPFAKKFEPLAQAGRILKAPRDAAKVHGANKVAMKRIVGEGPDFKAYMKQSRTQSARGVANTVRRNPQGAGLLGGGAAGTAAGGGFALNRKKRNS